MKTFCVMDGNLCFAYGSVDDYVTIKDIELEVLKGRYRFVPKYVCAGWRENPDGTWTDVEGFVWDKDGYPPEDCNTCRSPLWPEGEEWPPKRPKPEEPVSEAAPSEDEVPDIEPVEQDNTDNG